MSTNKHIQFLAIGDMVTDNFISLKDAEVVCDIDRHNCKLCVKFGQKIPYESAKEVKAVGNSANAAVAAARLGLTSALVASVGDDNQGKDCIKALEEQKVITDFVHTDNRYSTNYHFVLSYEAERTILIKHAPFSYTLPNDQDTKIDWIYFSSLGDHALEFQDEVVAWLKLHPETKVAFQPGTFQIKTGTERLKEIYALTEIFFCNFEEAQIILKTEEKDIKKLLMGIHALGPKKVVITDGPNGLTASDGDSIYTLPMYPDIKPPVERTGAGDATSSTITAMLVKGIPFKDALLYGPINSMNVVQYIGAQEGLLSQEKLEEYLKSAPENYKIS
jgi:ribokinase